ncbi:MAG: FixH family protein [Flavobacteriales bacterium]
METQNTPTKPKSGFHWGWRIAIFYSLFVIAMVSAVIFSGTMDTSLVEEDYYEKEVAFQQEINKKQNVVDDSAAFRIILTKDSVNIVFPENNEKGKISFINYSDAKSDKHFKLRLNHKQQSFPREIFKAGSYEIQVDWQHNNQNYYWEEKIMM